MSQIINIPAAKAQQTDGKAQQQNLDITFGSENDDSSPEHRITSVKYKSAMISQNISKAQLLLEVSKDNQSKEVESVNENNQKLQMIISPTASIQQKQMSLVNLNQPKPPQHSASKQLDRIRHLMPKGASTFNVPEEESFEDDEKQSLPGDHSDLRKAKQKLIEMEERYNKITFKKVANKKAAKEARDEAIKQKKKKDIIEKYNTIGSKQNVTTHDWSSTKLISLPNPMLKDESEEKEYNFKAHSKGSPYDSKSRLSHLNTTKNLNWTGSHEKTTDGGDGFQNVSKLNSLTMMKSNNKFYNSRQDKFMHNQTPQSAGNDKYSTQGAVTQINSKAITHQFSSLEQAKRFRQRSLFEAASKQRETEEISINENVDLDEMQRNQSSNSVGTSPLNFGTNTVPPPGPNSVFKNSRAHLIGSRLNTTSKLADISILPVPNSLTSQDKLPLTWAEEQRIKKLINDYETMELELEQSKEEDPLMKLKANLVFMQQKALKLVQNYCNQDICSLLERSLSNLISYNQQKISRFRNDLKFYEIEKMKHLKMIQDRDKLIEIFKIRDLSEEEKQKLSWKERQERMDKYEKIDKVIDELFTEQAIRVQKVEPHYLVFQPIEEQELEQEERTLNFRRMNWLEKDMELMMKLIQMDVSESHKIQTEVNYEKHLNVLAETLKEGVNLGIQNQIANFHLRIEDILKENQKILKSKAPEKIDRCYQTDTWNMERYLDELESLKRQKNIQDKELRDLKEGLEKNKDRIKKLKDDNTRLNKKIANMTDKERTIDQQLHDKDKQMSDIKDEALRRINESQKKEVEKAKEVKALQEKMDLFNKMKVDREVEIMKREEENSKKMEQMEIKLKEAKAAVNYFNKLLKKKEADLENTKEVFEMQLKIQSLIGSDNNSEAEDLPTKRTKKGNQKKGTKVLNMKEINESKELVDSNPQSLRRPSQRKEKDEFKLPTNSKKDKPSELGIQSMNLTIPINHLDSQKSKQGISPRISSRRKMSKIFSDSNQLKNSQHEKVLVAEINNSSADSKSIGREQISHQPLKDEIYMEGDQRDIFPEILVDGSLEVSKVEQLKNTHEDLTVANRNSEAVYANNNLNEISLRVSGEGNDTLDAADYNFMMGDSSKFTRIKHKELSITFDQISNNQIAISKNDINKQAETMLITTEEKSIQVDNPVVIYQPQTEKRKNNFQLNLNNQVQKPVMMPEETQTIEQIPYDYINMILRYEEDKKKQSLNPHVAKGLQKNKGILPSAGQLAALQDPLGNSKSGTLINQKGNATTAAQMYYQGEFLSNLENQLGTHKRASNPSNNNRQSISPQNSEQHEQEHHFAKPTVAAQKHQQLHGSSFLEHHNFARSPSTHNDKPLQNQQSLMQSPNGQQAQATVEIVPVVQNQHGQVIMLKGQPQSTSKHSITQQQQQYYQQQTSGNLYNTATFNPQSQGVPLGNTGTYQQSLYRVIQQIPSAITEEDINNRVDEQTDGNKSSSNQLWMQTTQEIQQQAIQATKKQIQEKITKNINVAINALVGKGHRNQATVMENIKNMRNVQAHIEQAVIKDEDDLKALNKIVESSVSPQVNQLAASKKISPPPRPLPAMTSIPMQQPQPSLQPVLPPSQPLVLTPAPLPQMRQINFDSGQPMSQSVGIGATKQSQLFKSNEGPQFVMMPNQNNGMVVLNNTESQNNNERSGLQSSKYTMRADTSQKDVRNSLNNLDLLEYYQKMKPQVGFQAMLIGRPMSIEEVRLTSHQLVERSRSNSPTDKFKINLPNVMPEGGSDPYFFNQDLPPQDQMNQHYNQHM